LKTTLVVGAGVGVDVARVTRGSKSIRDTKLGGGVTTIVGPGVGRATRLGPLGGGGGSRPIFGSSLFCASESGRSTVPVVVSTRPPFATPFVPTERRSITLPTTTPST
jgi:hypothetical protein